jgi:hypothetical protein
MTSALIPNHCLHWWKHRPHRKSALCNNCKPSCTAGTFPQIYASGGCSAASMSFHRETCGCAEHEPFHIRDLLWQSWWKWSQVLVPSHTDWTTVICFVLEHCRVGMLMSYVHITGCCCTALKSCYASVPSFHASRRKLLTCISLAILTFQHCLLRVHASHTSV